MKILLIGGSGNISTECARVLFERGHEILVVTRGSSSLPPEYHAIKADRRDPAVMTAALQGTHPEVVINFLGYDQLDIQIDHHLFQGSVLQYVFISSATVYAKPPARLPITEDARLGNAWWDYAQKKLACEQWLLKWWREERFPVTIVRPSHTYSRHWIPNPISSASYTFAARLEQGKPVFIPDKGKTPWTLTAASDFAVGLAGLLGKAEALGEAFHITSDEVLTWNQIYSEIAAALGVQFPQIVQVPTDFICEMAPSLSGNLKGDKSHPAVFDNSKIKAFVPDFVCRKPFRVGIRESVAWLRQHPEQQQLNPEVDEMIDQVVHAWALSEQQKPS